MLRAECICPFFVFFCSCSSFFSFFFSLSLFFFGITLSGYDVYNVNHIRLTAYAAWSLCFSLDSYFLNACFLQGKEEAETADFRCGRKRHVIHIRTLLPPSQDLDWDVILWEFNQGLNSTSWHTHTYKQCHSWCKVVLKSIKKLKDTKWRLSRPIYSPPWWAAYIGNKNN